MKFHITGTIIFTLIFVSRGITLVYRWECYYFVWLEMDLDVSYFSCNGCMEIWYAYSWIVTHFTSENTTLCVFQFTVFIHTIRPTFLCELKSVVFVWFFDNFKIHVKRNQKYRMHIYIYILSVRKIFGEDGELMSLILPGIINRSMSVCHLHPIQGLVVIYMPSYFFTTMVFLVVFLNVKRA